MLLADDLIIKKNCSKEMIALHKKTKGSVIATKKVKKKNSIKMGNFGFKNKKEFIFNKQSN